MKMTMTLRRLGGGRAAVKEGSPPFEASRPTLPPAAAAATGTTSSPAAGSPTGAAVGLDNAARSSPEPASARCSQGSSAFAASGIAFLPSAWSMFTSLAAGKPEGSLASASRRLAARAAASAAASSPAPPPVAPDDVPRWDKPGREELQPLAGLEQPDLYMGGYKRILTAASRSRVLSSRICKQERKGDGCSSHVKPIRWQRGKRRGMPADTGLPLSRVCQPPTCADSSHPGANRGTNKHCAALHTAQHSRNVTHCHLCRGDDEARRGRPWVDGLRRPPSAQVPPGVLGPDQLADLIRVLVHADQAHHAWVCGWRWGGVESSGRHLVGMSRGDEVIVALF